MTRKITLFSLIMTTLLASCSKEDTPDTEKFCIVTSLYKIDDKGKRYAAEDLTYDSLGRLTHVTTYRNDSAFYKYTATYDDAKKIVAIDDGKFPFVRMVLDDKGNAQRAQTFYTGEVYLFSYKDDYLYSVTRQFLSAYNMPDAVFTLQYSNGNLISINGPNGYAGANVKFEYDDHPAVLIPGASDPLSYVDAPVIYPGVFGKPSKNRLVKVIETMDYTPVLLRTTTYEYETDQDGKTTAIKVRSGLAELNKKERSSESYTIHFEYTCKD